VLIAWLLYRTPPNSVLIDASSKYLACTQPTPTISVYYLTPPLSTWTLLQHAFREVLIRLPHTEIPQNLLRSAQNRIKLVRAVELLDHASHTRLRQSAAAENIDGFVSDVVRGAGGVGLEEADGATKEFGLLGVGHVGHLISDGFEPGLVGFNEGDHFRESVRNGSMDDT
jgi:hypothetical protein